MDMKFSVSMCVYKNDNPEHFGLAIESVLDQTLPPDEIVLVVDGPIPEVIENVIENFREKLKVIYLPENKGHGEARRIGFENCKNELIALMDADDISVKERFEWQIDEFKKNEDLDIVGGYIIEFAKTTDNEMGKRIVPAGDTEIKEYMKKRCPMNQVTVMFKKASVAAVGGYIDWYCEEDYYLWIRMMQGGCKFFNIEKNLVFVRTDEGMYSRRGGIKYFKSEARLQKYMRKNKITGFMRYHINITERLIIQVLMPNRLREWVFKKIARD